ncbi:helix-turn-helix domain-containing protein [Streptomyces winkii]|uniref:helix-turn-helix domain-containing protein n=1 Tax=Streptomyces winkii TaxID=3051178 RepID=UPI0028D71736|nr:helix-turn-helix domain-containing protein [Streptomyces sp. DSM 40971]
MPMMSLFDLMRAPVDVLCYHPGPGTLRRDSVAVDRVVITDADWQLAEAATGPGTGTGAVTGAGPGTGTSILAVVPAEGGSIGAAAVPRALSGLVEAGVTAIALAAGPQTFPDGVEREAARLNIPVLVPARPSEAGAAGIRADVVDVQVAVLEAQREQIARGTRLAAELERSPEDAPARLTKWLAEEMAREEVTAMLVPPPGPPDIVAGNASAEREYERVRDGLAPTAHIPGQPGQAHVLLNPASAVRPYDVLVAVGPWPWTPHHVDLARQTARHIVHSQGHAYGRRLRQTELALRVAILQQLLTGDVASARRASRGLPSGNLTGHAARMAVLECATPADRELAMYAAERATEGRALVAECPAVARHVLIVLPQQTARDDQHVRAMLSPLTRGSGAAVGVSTAMPYYATAHAYTAARGALAAARGGEDRIAVHPGGTTLGGELPRSLYSAWAAVLREPLAVSRRVPEDQRDVMVHTTALAVALGTTAASRLLGIGSTTARRHVEGVMGAMRLDHRQVAHRAVAQLALQAPPAGHDAATPVRPLTALLAHEGPRKWAEEVLRPLNGQPEAVELLATWLRCNTETIATARTAVLGRNTVARRLDRMAHELALPLTDPGGGGHETLWALTIRGDLREPLPDPAKKPVLL